MTELKSPTMTCVLCSARVKEAKKKNILEAEERQQAKEHTSLTQFSCRVAEINALCSFNCECENYDCVILTLFLQLTEAEMHFVGVFTYVCMCI